MNNIILNSEGIFVEEYNSNLKSMELLPISEPLAYYYGNYVELSNDLTFGNLFKLLEPHIAKLEDHFMFETRKYPLKPYFDIIKKDSTEDLGFKAIQFSWTYDYFEYYDRKTDKTDKTLDNYVHLTALSLKDENYSMSFVGLNNIKDVPVKISKDCQIYGPDYKTIILEFEKEMTLRDFIGGLLNEITFYGSPDQMEETLNTLTEQTEKYKSGELGTVSWESIKLKWLEEELQEALAEEDYGWAERVKKEIEKVKNEENE